MRLKGAEGRQTGQDERSAFFMRKWQASGSKRSVAIEVDIAHGTRTSRPAHQAALPPDTMAQNSGSGTATGIT